MTKDKHCQTLNHIIRSWPYSYKVNRHIEKVCEIQLPFEIKSYEMQFCGNNVVVVRCILQEMHFVVIIMVIISYVLKIEQEGGRRLCENSKGGHEQKTVEKHCIRRYGPPLNVAFSKCPSSQINCPPLP